MLGAWVGPCQSPWDEWQQCRDERRLFPRIPPTSPCVVHAFALAVHAAVALGGGFFGAAALVGDFGHAFLFGAVVGAGCRSLGVGEVRAGEQGQCQAGGQQCRDGCPGAVVDGGGTLHGAVFLVLRVDPAMPRGGFVCAKSRRTGAMYN